MRAKKRGFTLTETIVVLGVVGIVLSAIWVSSAAVADKARLESGANQIWQLALAIRNVYQGHPYAAADTDVTANMVAQNIITPDMIDAGVTVNPWGGAYTVHFINSTQFYITSALPAVPALSIAQQAAICSDMLTRIQSIGPAVGGGGAAPVPTPFPTSAGSMQGGLPTNAYYSVGGNWVDATGLDVEAVGLGVAGGCDGVAFYFTM